MFTDANYKFYSNCLGLWVKCRRQLICLGFGGFFLHDNCRLGAYHIWKALQNRDVTSGRWWTWILCWWVEGTGGTAVVIEQWIENALVSQGRAAAKGWAIISRGEALAECRGLTHLTTCFSWVSHLTMTHIEWNSIQASEQVCWEPEVCADLSVCMWFFGEIPESLPPFPVVQSGFAYFYRTSKDQGGVKPHTAVPWAWRCKELRPSLVKVTHNCSLALCLCAYVGTWCVGW